MASQIVQNNFIQNNYKDACPDEFCSEDFYQYRQRVLSEDEEYKWNLPNTKNRHESSKSTSSVTEENLSKMTQSNLAITQRKLQMDIAKVCAS